LKKKK